jgi:hypothetical protein
VASAAVIELHDVALRCTAGSELLESPGHALITPRGIVTGAEARARAWLEPQYSVDRHWQQLGTGPLPASSRHARHFADLAYAQLLDLYRAAGQPERVIFAIPGHLGREQLAVLLGIANATPFAVAGLIDAALAATVYSALRGEILHLDLLRHCAVLTRLHAGSEIERIDVRVLPEIGLNQLHDLWAQHIAERFIARHRYDPLHTGAGEQALRDALPGWLAELAARPEIDVQLPGPRGPLSIALTAAELAERAAAHYALLERAAAAGGGDSRLLAAALARLPDIGARIPGRGLPPEAAVAGGQACAEYIATRPANVLITRLPATEKDRPTAGPRALPTHLLWRHRAHDLRAGLVIDRQAGLLTLHPPGCEPDTDVPALRLAFTSGRLVLRGALPGIRVDGDSADLRTGDRLHIGAEVLELIEVL